MIYLTAAELSRIAEHVLGCSPEIRDPGLLDAAAARPRASWSGRDAYPDLAHKAAALLHSLAMGHALVDGNKRLALAGTAVFVRVNGYRLALTNDQAYDLVVDVVTDNIDAISDIATRLPLTAA